MKIYSIFISIVFLLFSCKDSKKEKLTSEIQQEDSLSDSSTYKKEDRNDSLEQAIKFKDFIPQNYFYIYSVYGDLNKDNIEDCIIIIKGTQKDKLEKNRSEEIVDRNRRGLIVLLGTNNGFEKIVENNDCFSSENEDGGVYYAPELEISIAKGNLQVDYNHGRYGTWWYTFRYNNKNFELIGFDREELRGPITESETSINFLTNTKIYKENTNENTEEEGQEVFKTTKSKIKTTSLLKLTEIEDFDGLNIGEE